MVCAIGVLSSPARAASRARTLTAADLDTAFPTGEQLRPIGGKPWFEGSTMVLTGMQPGFPADPQLSRTYISPDSTGPIDASLSRFERPAEAERLAGASAERDAGDATIVTVPGLGDHSWLYPEGMGADQACTVRMTVGGIVARLTLARAASALKSPRASGGPCTPTAAAPLIAVAKIEAKRMTEVAAGTRRAPATPRALEAVIPPGPAGGRALGVIVRGSDWWAVDQSRFKGDDLANPEGRAQYRLYKNMIGGAGATQLATSTWVFDDTMLLGTVGVFRTAAGAATWAEDLISDNPKDQKPVALPGVDAGYIVRTLKGAGANQQITNLESRIAVGKAALSLFCLRPWDNEPLGAAQACSKAIDDTMRAWTSQVRR